MRRFVLAVLATLPLLACQDQVTQPFNVAPELSLSSYFPTRLLASTGEAELVELDLEAGTASLVGKSVVEGLSNLGWTDVATDASGNLYAMTSRNLQPRYTEPCSDGVFYTSPCFRLFVLDPGTGAALAEIGSTQGLFIGDMDFADDGTLFGTKFLNEPGRGWGALVTVDPSTAVHTVVGQYGAGVGNYDIEPGGLSVHPETGELWGVESSYSFEPTVYRIDPATGLASQVTRLGLNGEPSRFGLNALEILPDGRFLASAPNYEGLYWLDPYPDAVSGLAELTEITISMAPDIDGWITGLDFVGSITPGDLIGDIEALVGSGSLDEQQSKSLLSKINLVEKFIDEGKIGPAISLLEAFIAQVQGYVNGGLLPADSGQALVGAAQSIIDDLSL